MRLAWTFFAGMALAGLAILTTAPIVGGLAAAAYYTRGDLWTVLAGQSQFAAREDNGRIAGRMTNVSFQPISVVLAGDPRPRRLLTRLQVDSSEFAGAGEGRIRIDGWLLDSAGDLKKRPLYTVISPGRGATLDPEGVLTIDRGGQRRSSFSLADGVWLFDADTPLAGFTVSNDRRRYLAVAQADDDLPAGSVAVITYASPRRMMTRLLVRVEDPVRARFLRGTVPATRPVLRTDDGGSRTLELTLAAGMIRLPIAEEALDLSKAEVPAGLVLIEMKPWRSPPVVTP